TVASTSGANTTVQVGSLQTVSLVTADTTNLIIEGTTSSDILTVDSTNGAVAIPITYNGGAGTNALVLTGGTETSETYTPGSQAGAGTIALAFSGVPETINFLNLAPIFDMIAGPLVVLGTNAADSINYAEGFNNLANFLVGTRNVNWGEVSVD